MDKTSEQRREQRLLYDWPIWFGEDFKKTHFSGQMLDVSSKGAAFTCRADENRPYPGQQVTTRFRVPRFGSGNPFNMIIFTKAGHISRVDDVSDALCRAAIQFAEPLFFKPGEQGISASDVQRKLDALAV